ncbi:MAG: cell division topological specificity factor MinE [Clostridiales bacterium]|nr:cell division topological specificity factor MinE [Candidatus Apopatousia equi]
MGLFYEASAKEDENRLRQVLIADKHFNPERIKEVIKSDMYNVLKNYAEISPDDVFIDIELNSSGMYHFKFDAIMKRLKIFGSLPDEN